MSMNLGVIKGSPTSGQDPSTPASTPPLRMTTCKAVMDDRMHAQPRTWSSAWSIPLMCLGLGVIAACMLVPQAEANKRLVAERDKLKRDLAYVDTQISVNDEFLKDVAGNAGVAERLAQ